MDCNCEAAQVDFRKWSPVPFKPCVCSTTSFEFLEKLDPGHIGTFLTPLEPRSCGRADSRVLPSSPPCSSCSGGYAVTMSWVALVGSVAHTVPIVVPPGDSACSPTGPLQVVDGGPWLSQDHIMSLPLRTKPGVELWTDRCPGSMVPRRAVGCVAVSIRGPPW